jgi:orotidine-5'-phosphate decarboxylase
MNGDVGLLVNVGRDILFAGKGEDFAEKAGAKAREYAQEMGGYLK